MALVLVLALTPGIRAAQEQTELEKEFDLLAKQIVNVLQDKKTSEMRFGTVTCKEDKNDPHGSGIRVHLERRLTERKVVITDTATYELVVEYGYERKTKDSLEEIYVTARLRKGKEVANLPPLKRLSSKDMRDKCLFSSHCVELNPSASRMDRDKVFADSRDKDHRKFEVGGEFNSRISANKGSRYSVEIEAGPKGGKARLVARTPVAVEGCPQVTLSVEEEYVIRVYNTSDHEIIAQVFVDGVDIFQFSRDSAKGVPK